MHPKVTVIIPVYNCLPYIHECLDSVVNQTLQDIEVILIDDGCSDGTEKVINAYAKKDKRIKLLRQSNQGAAIARNNGLAVAKGEYLSFLDSDDIFYLNMLEEMYIQAKKYDVDIVICPFRFLGDKEIVNRGLTVPLYLKNINKFKTSEISKDIFQITSPSAWSKLFKTSFIKDKMIDFQNLSTCNDLYFSFYALALSENISILNNIYVTYRRNSSTAISRFRGEKFENIFKALSLLLKSIEGHENFEDYKLSYFKRSVSSIAYESTQINRLDDVKEFVQLSINFLSKLEDQNSGW